MDFFDVNLWDIGGPTVPGCPLKSDTHVYSLAGAEAAAKRLLRTTLDTMCIEALVEIVPAGTPWEDTEAWVVSYQVDRIHLFLRHRQERGEGITIASLEADIARVRRQLAARQMHPKRNDGHTLNRGLPPEIQGRFADIPLEGFLERAEAAVNRMRAIGELAEVPDPIVRLSAPAPA